MCGLLGFTGEFDFDPLKIKMLFLYNEQRGADSCGIYTEPKTGNGTLVKKVGKASNLIVTDKLVPTNFLIGHTRKMTVGLVSEANAHPYKYSNLVGAHNGGISNYVMLANSREIPGPDYYVDSQALYRCMEKDKGYLKALQDYDGGAALLFTLFNEGILTNSESHKLYAYHDKDKPLFHGRIKINGKTGTYISSIKESLEAIECTKIREFPIDTLHIFEKGKLIHTEKIKRDPLKYKSPVTTFREDELDLTCGYNEKVYGASRVGAWDRAQEARDRVTRSRSAHYSPVDNYRNPQYTLYTGADIEPSALGKGLIGSFAKFIKKATVVYADLTGRTMSIKILELTEDAPEQRYFVNQIFKDVKMEHFQHVTKPIELPSPLKKVENSADVEVEKKSEIVPAVALVEKELSCSDFDDYRDQYWATLMTIREKAKKISDDGYWNVQQNADELQEFVEDEIFTLFAMNV